MSRLTPQIEVPRQSFQRIEQSWEQFWAEFWRIRLVLNDEAVVWKNQQVVDFAWEVLGLREGMRLLDVGCGAGFQAQLFAQRGLIVHGIDISSKLVSHARKLVRRLKLPATFEAADMRTFRVETPYDRVAVLGMSFGFGTDEENERTLRNIHGAVRPGGRILLTGQHPYSASSHAGPEWMETPEGVLLHRGDFDPITSRLGGSWELVRPDGTIITEGENPESDGIRCYTAPEMRGLLERNGFTNIRFYGSWFLPAPELQWFSMEMITVADRPDGTGPKVKSKKAH